MVQDPYFKERIKYSFQNNMNLAIVKFTVYYFFYLNIYGES